MDETDAVLQLAALGGNDTMMLDVLSSRHGGSSTFGFPHSSFQRSEGAQPRAAGLIYRPFDPSTEESKVLTEKEVMQSWGRLFRKCELSEPLFEKAETLLEEIKPESPVRHRLANELEELRMRHAGQKEEVGAK